MRPPSREGPRIFISYLGEDAAGRAGRLYDALVEHFGAERVRIFTLDAVRPEMDYSEALESIFGSAEVLIALIGRHWLRAADLGFAKQSDRVRLEIETALRKGMQVIPVLVQGAEMPSPDALPEALRPITRRQAARLTDSSWHDDEQRLLSHLDDLAWPDISSPVAAVAKAGAEPAKLRRSSFGRWFEGRGQRKADEDEVSGVERDVE